MCGSVVHLHRQNNNNIYRTLTCEKTEIPSARMGALQTIPTVHPCQFDIYAGLAINRIGTTDHVGAHRHCSNWTRWTLIHRRLVYLARTSFEPCSRLLFEREV